MSNQTATNMKPTMTLSEKILIKEIEQLIFHAEKDTLHYSELEHARKLIFYMKMQRTYMECHEYVGNMLIYKCATVCAQLPNCLLKRTTDEANKGLAHWKHNTIEGENLGEMNHLKEPDTER